MRSQRKKKVISSLILFSSLCLALYSQLGLGSGRIKGVVKNKSGNPVAGAKITVKNLTYNTIMNAESDKEGRWSVSGLASGKYFIAAEKEGYRKEQIELTISFAQGRSQTLDITLTELKSRTPGETSSRGESSAVTKLLNEGNDLYKEGRINEALEKFEQFLIDNPSFYQVYINIGNCYKETKNYDKAIAAFTKFLEVKEKKEGTLKGDKEASGVLGTIGQLYIDQGETDKAKEYFKKAVDNDLADEVLAYNVGVIFFQEGQADLAIEYLNFAIKLKKDWPLPYEKIGYVYLNKGNYKAAIESFQKFLELAPDDPQAPTIKNLIPQLRKLGEKNLSQHSCA